MLPNPQETADLVTFTEEIPNEKLHFLCSELFLLTIGYINQRRYFHTEVSKVICQRHFCDIKDIF